MFVSGEDIADVVSAVQGIASVKHVHVAPSFDPNAFCFVIALSPYRISEIIEVHYAVVEATGGRELSGRVHYVDGEVSSPARGRPVTLSDEERAAAQTRIEDRKALAELTPIYDRPTIASAFRPFAELPSALSVSFGARPHVEEPPRRMRVLVVDEDPTTARRIGELPDIDVIEVTDGWSAVDRLKEGDVDLAVCAVKVGEFSGAKIHKLVATANPKMARRIVYLATEAALSQAPPSSASGRLLARPISPEAVRSMLETLGPVS